MDRWLDNRARLNQLVDWLLRLLSRCVCYNEWAAYIAGFDADAGGWTSTTILENSFTFHFDLMLQVMVIGLAVAAPPLQTNTFLVPDAMLPEYSSCFLNPTDAQFGFGMV